MKNIHASEQAIQDYATDQLVTNEEKTHIEFCGQCLAVVKSYQLLFVQIQREPSAAFDFELSVLVTKRLPKAKSRLSVDRFIAGFLILFITSFVGIPVILFKQYIMNMFSGISPSFIYSILCASIIILIYKSLEMYRKYQKQMQLLNPN